MGGGGLNPPGASPCVVPTGRCVYCPYGRSNHLKMLSQMGIPIFFIKSKHSRYWSDWDLNAINHCSAVTEPILHAARCWQITIFHNYKSMFAIMECYYFVAYRPIEFPIHFHECTVLLTRNTAFTKMICSWHKASHFPKGRTVQRCNGFSQHHEPYWNHQPWPTAWSWEAGFLVF